MSDLSDRLGYLTQRLRTAYDGIGHSRGRPYVYFVYPPEQELLARRIMSDELRSDEVLAFHHLDLLQIAIQSTRDQELRREALLNDPIKGASAAASLLRLWTRRLIESVNAALAAPPSSGKPVIVLHGLAALHPLATPTGMMEVLAEQEPRDPATARVVPIILLIPGIRPPQTSREYLFLGQEQLRLSFYRGEEA